MTHIHEQKAARADDIHSWGGDAVNSIDMYCVDPECFLHRFYSLFMIISSSLSVSLSYFYHFVIQLLNPDLKKKKRNPL